MPLPALPKPFWVALKLIVTAVAIWLVWNKIDFSALGPPLREARFAWLAVFIALQYAVMYLNAARWRCLMAIPDTPLRKYLYYVFVGTFLALVLPSAALAEGARTYAFGRRYGGVQENFAAILFARLSGFVIQVVIMIVAVLMARDTIAALPLWTTFAFDPLPVYAAAAALLVGGAVAWRFFRLRLVSFWRAFAAYLASDRSARIRLARVLGYSLLIQVVTMLGVWVIFRVVGASVGFWHVAVIPTLVQLILLLPVSFGGVGVREYLNVMLFSRLAGVPAETTLAASLLLYVSWIMLAATGGLWYMFRRFRAVRED